MLQKSEILPLVFLPFSVENFLVPVAELHLFDSHNSLAYFTLLAWAYIEYPSVVEPPFVFSFSKLGIPKGSEFLRVLDSKKDPGLDFWGVPKGAFTWFLNLLSDLGELSFDGDANELGEKHRSIFGEAKARIGESVTGRVGAFLNSSLWLNLFNLKTYF